MQNPRSVFGGEIAPGFTVVHGAYMTAPAFDAKSQTYTGAVYSHTGALVPNSVRPGAFANYRPVDPLSIDRANFVETPIVRGQAIFGGHYFYAWGHFIIETLATAATEGMPHCPVVYLPWNIAFESTWANSYFDRALPVTSAAWGGRKIIVSRKAMRFEQLYIPNRLTAFGVPGKIMHSSVVKVYDRVRNALAGAGFGSHIVVTRDRAHRRFLQNEEAIYKSLVNAGFIAIKPETLSPSEQVNTMANAETIIGMRGSALHNAAFARPGARVIEIGDLPDTAAPNVAQNALATICAHDFHFVHAFTDGKLRPTDEVVEAALSVI